MMLPLSTEILGSITAEDILKSLCDQCGYHNIFSFMIQYMEDTAGPLENLKKHQWENIYMDLLSLSQDPKWENFDSAG